MQQVPIEEKVTFTGGVMKNIGVCEKLRQELSPKKVNLPDEPQIAGTLGGAIIAKRRVAVQAN